MGVVPGCLLHYPSGGIPRPVLCPSYPWGVAVGAGGPGRCAGGSGRAKAKELPLCWWGRAGRGERFPFSGRSWRASAETYFHVNFWCLPENAESDFLAIFCEFKMNF